MFIHTRIIKSRSFSRKFKMAADMKDKRQKGKGNFLLFSCTGEIVTYR